MPYTFVAQLVGSDGQIVSRGFGEEADALAWLRGDGWAHLEGVAARGEVHREGGLVVWTMRNSRDRLYRRAMCCLDKRPAGTKYVR